MSKKHTNRLIHETSPYLLQHAHNPVDWYPWGDEGFEKAIKENKPVLISIGYSACHWCHVMERESFEDEETARIMNELFINIKIDREERPDIDHIYMDAVQAMSGNGGWPLNVFLTPDRKPFFGGTYFPPVKAFNRSSWKEVLLGVSDAFKNRRQEINAQAENLTEHLMQSNAFGLQKPVNDETIFTKEKADELFINLMKTADRQWGGFSRAPKFPQTLAIQFLLRYFHVYNNEEALSQALLSLDKMINGGIYDQLAGGFARYSTDTEWLAPHFEKMLYDNALMISVLCEAYQVSKVENYRLVIEETVEFITTELMHPDGGFWSALDADSEGVEGKFYVWEKNEIEKLLGTDADLFCEFYDITEKGNFEHKNILNIKIPAASFCKNKQMTREEFNKIISRSKKRLLDERNKRVRPGLDDKILLGWNSLMNASLSKAYACTGNEKYRRLALDNMNFLLKNFTGITDHAFSHTWKNGEAKYPAFLDDYAYLIEALINIQEISGDTVWLIKAKQVTAYVIENFSDTETGFFFFTRNDQQDVIVRKKEVYDGATPSGNAVMAQNLSRLSIYFDISDWKLRAQSITKLLSQAIVRYPVSFGYWANNFIEQVAGTNEIAIVGKNHDKILKEILAQYIPNKVIMSSAIPDINFGLLAGKQESEQALIYLCRDYACKEPVQTTKSLVELLLTA